MSVDIHLTAVTTVDVFELNIPLIQPLQIGLRLLELAPAQFETFPQEYFEQFVGQVQTYLEACKANPDAEVSATS